MNQSCCCCGRRDIVKLLLDHGADFDAATSSINSTPHACKNGDLFTTKLVLDRGCAVNFVDKYGKTALHHACLGRCTECVKELLAHGEDTTVKNKNGKNPLDVAGHQTGIDVFKDNEKRSESIQGVLHFQENLLLPPPSSCRC